MTMDSAAVQNVSVSADRVREAFAAVGRGDLGPISQLQGAGQAVVPLVAPYLADGNEAVRREAVSLLAVVGGKSALAPLAKALVDPSAEVADRAALALYHHYEPADLAALDELAGSVATALSQEAPAAATVLLAAWFPTTEVDRALRKLASRPADELAKLDLESAPVSRSLAAKLSLARHGAPEDQDALITIVERATPAEAEFLLAALREIDASATLRAVATATLGDRRDAATLTHSAPAIRPRICDLAVVAFGKRLNLPVDFELSKLRHYDDEQVRQVARLVEQAVPDRPIPQS